MLESNWPLFISIIIQTGIWSSDLFDPLRSKRTASFLCDFGWLQWSGNLGCYPKAVLHKCICNPRVQLETFVSAPYIILSVGLHGKIEPCSTFRGNSRASLLTDMSWKLASYFGWNPRLFSSFPPPLIKKKKKQHISLEQFWNPGSPIGALLPFLGYICGLSRCCMQKTRLWDRKFWIRTLEYLREGKDLVLLCKRRGCKACDTNLGSWCLTQKLNCCRNEMPRALGSCVITSFSRDVY